MVRPVSGFIWLVCFLCISLVLGLPGCSFHNTTIASQFNLLVQDKLFLRRNIGLVGGTSIVDEDITLNDVSDPTQKDGILLQMFQGTWDGALSGLETGQIFCWGGTGNGKRTIHISGKSGGADALILLILCGGGMVAGVGLGAAVGLLTPFVLSQHSTEILVARKRVVQGVWKELVSKKESKSSQLDHSGASSSGALPSAGITFGSRAQAFTAFMRLENIHVGLFSKSYFDAGSLALAWNIKVTFFDSRRRVVARQIIEMEQGDYSFEKWADQEALFLKEKLREGYRLIAGEILDKLTQVSSEQ